MKNDQNDKAMDGWRNKSRSEIENLLSLAAQLGADEDQLNPARAEHAALCAVADAAGKHVTLGEVTGHDTSCACSACVLWNALAALAAFRLYPGMGTKSCRGSVHA